MRPVPAAAVLVLIGAPLVAASVTAPEPARSPASSSVATRLERIHANPNRARAGTLRKGVLTLHLELRTGTWHPEADDGPSLEIQAFGEAGKPLQVPGPLIRVTEGTEIRVTVGNTLRDSTLVVHGLHTRPGSADDTLQVKPGATREVRFVAGAPGTYHYWGATTGAPMEERVLNDSQLSGALIIDPRGAAVPDDRVFVMGLWFRPADSSGAKPTPEQEVMVINGKSWPHTERLTFTVGDSVRWRWINPTASSHPMHLHGFYFRVDSRGSWAADTTYAPAHRQLAVTELMLPGATNALVWVPEREGNWLFHCHFAFHVSHQRMLPPADGAPPHANGHASDHSAHRMAGLVLGMHVLPKKGTPAQLASASAVAPRRLRLIIDSIPKRYGKEPGYGFMLHEGGAEPSRDSLPVAGPTIVLRRGEPVAITVVNRLGQPSAVHWHGIELESFPDGVPGWSGKPGRIMPPIAPRDSFVAEFVPPRAGTFIYHSHSNEQAQISSGMYGALVVVDPERPLDPVRDRVILVGSNGPENRLGTVNGSTTPPPMDLDVGTTYRLRLININTDWRVMFSLVSDSGYVTWRPLAKDGADLPASQAAPRRAHLVTGPGETADFEFTPTAPGELRLEVKTQLTGWHVPVRVRVRDTARRP